MEGKIPPHFEENAIAAVAAATSVVEMLLDDPDVRDGLVGVPHYIHSMIAFACVFLLRVSIQHKGQYTNDETINDLTTKAAQQFRSTAVGKHHLVHLMAEGLEKMILSKPSNSTPISAGLAGSNEGPLGTVIGAQSSTVPLMTDTSGIFNAHYMGNIFGDDFGVLGTIPFIQFDTNGYDYSQTRFDV